MTPARPGPAATVVLVTEQEPMRVFLLRRHSGSAFMANASVFPGGRVESGDEADEARDRLVGVDLEALADRMVGVTSPEAAGAHLVAALRETFEESGVLLARPRGSEGPLIGAGAGRSARWRRRLNAGETTFVEILQDGDLELAGDRLGYFAHWITPAIEGRRFDTRFFLARAPREHELARHDDQETTASSWWRPDEALSLYNAGDITLAPPTWTVLSGLAALSDAADAEAWARRQDPVLPIEPHPDVSEGSLVLALPGDTIHPTSPASGRIRRFVIRRGRWALIEE